MLDNPMQEAERGLMPEPPHWFRLAFACRWPAAFALTAWALAVAAIQILKQPIPIALPLDQPLPVKLVGELTINTSQQPLNIKGSDTLRIAAAKTLPVTGSVDVKGGVAVEAVKAPVSVQGENGAPLIVSSKDDAPLHVNGSVKVNENGGEVQVQIRDAAKSLLPIP